MRRATLLARYARTIFRRRPPCASTLTGRSGCKKEPWTPCVYTSPSKKGPFVPYSMAVAEAIKREPVLGKCYLSVGTASADEIRQ